MFFSQRYAAWRAFCATGPGGGVDNSCGVKAVGSPEGGSSSGEIASQHSGFDDLFRQNKSGTAPLGTMHGNAISGAEKVRQLSVSDARAVESFSRDAGIASLGSLLTIGAANSDGASVTVHTESTTRYVDGERLPMRTVRVSSDSPVVLGDDSYGKATVSVTVELVDGKKPAVHYGFFQRSAATQARISQEKQSNPETGYSKTEASLGASIFDKMLDSLEEAERSGISMAYTEASGMPGSNVYQGYRLWGRFGLDAELDADIVDEVILQSASGKKIVPPDIEDKATRTGVLTLQELISTKDGERWWRENGRAVNLSIDLSDKNSDGYKRFKAMASKRRAAKSRGGRSYLDFVSFAVRSDMSTDVGDWIGFRIADLEKRISEVSAFAASRSEIS